MSCLISQRNAMKSSLDIASKITNSNRLWLDSNGIKNVSDAVSKFHDMIEMRPRASVIQFNKLISSVVKTKHYSVALNMFDNMRQRSIPFDNYTLNISINCYCRLGCAHFGFATLAIFFKCGYVPDVATFTTLIKGLFLGNKVAEAENLFKKMLREKLCEPNEFTFSIVIDGLCKAGNADAAAKLLAMLEKGRCKPEVRAYSTIMDTLCKHGKVDDAVQLLSKMIGNGINPSAVTYTSLIQGFCDLGRWNEAKDLLNDMATYGILPNIVTYNTLIDAFCKEGKVKYGGCAGNRDGMKYCSRNQNV